MADNSELGLSQAVIIEGIRVEKKDIQAAQSIMASFEEAKVSTAASLEKAKVSAIAAIEKTKISALANLSKK